MAVESVESGDKSQRLFLRVLAGEPAERPPVWLMRQAGRYLPEYREVRAKARNFVDFCLSPALAAEVTLQPIRRYGFDASIVFADILLLPDAMGRPVTFEVGEGPRFEPIATGSELDHVPLETALARVSPVCETLERVRAGLPDQTALIGFAGAPWTVATYLIEGRGGTDKAHSRLFALKNPEGMNALIERLSEFTAHYLAAQVNAGADSLMLFESWAEGLPDDMFERWVMMPHRYILQRLRQLGVNVPVIGFPRGAGGNYSTYLTQSGMNGVSLDTSVPLAWARQVAPSNVTLQGNLDPMLVIAGGEVMKRRIDSIIDGLSGRPHIFNLGHGITPEAPPEHVTDLVKRVRGLI
jgi:uroporphyrinogen decarboxylase